MNKKLFLISILIVIVLFVVIHNMFSIKKSDIKITVKSIEEISATGMNIFGGEEDYVKVKISIFNNSKKEVNYYNNKIIKLSGEEINSELLSVDSDDNLTAYTTIKSKEKLEGYVYFKTSYEEGMQLKTDIVFNLKSKGNNISGKSEEYFCKLIK